MTVSTVNRERIFGDIGNGEVGLNTSGIAVAESWEWLAEQYPYVDLDQSIVMPDHLHGILIIRDYEVGVRKPLGRLVGAFKTVSTKRINEIRGTPAAVVWHRNFYEHVVRNDADLERIREYIATNPARWELRREDAR